MYIPSYQIHNVLKVYSKQVSQSRILERQNGIDQKPSVDKINISAEGKRKVIIDKVASDIVDRITQFGPEDKVGHDIANRLEDEIGQPMESGTENRKKEIDFVYNVIDDQNNKTTNTISVENSNFLAYQPEELEIEETDENMDK